MSVALPDGFESLILSGAQPPATNLPIGFVGLVLSFSGDTIFINVKNGLGKPIAGMTIITPFGGASLTGFTDAEGNIQILSDATATIQFKKEKTFRNRAYARASEGNIINYVFNVPLLE